MRELGEVVAFEANQAATKIALHRHQILAALRTTTDIVASQELSPPLAHQVGQPREHHLHPHVPGTR